MDVLHCKLLELAILAVDGPFKDRAPVVVLGPPVDVRVRLDEDPLHVGPGERVLLHGVSGSGKTLLFRALAGLWDVGRGSIIVPEQGRALYLPTHAYVPPGTLIESVCYPHPPGDYASGQVAAALAKCQPVPMDLPALAA